MVLGCQVDSERWDRMDAGQTVADKEEGSGRSGDGRHRNS